MNGQSTREKLTTTVRPFLRWAGSKRQLLPELEKYWSSQHVRYVEPFVGSACLFFRLLPQKALLGDLNKELISTYLEVKYRVKDVLSEVAKLRVIRKSEETYKDLRAIDASSLPRAGQAARFIYLNRFCFNGLFRTNLAGQFNVPYGGEKAGYLPSDEVLRACSRSLKNAHLITGDFGKVLAKVQKGDFVYMDPPFSVEERRVFKEYNGMPFGSKDVDRLREWLEILASKKIDFLVSYAQCDEADTLRKGFRCRDVEVRRNISGFASGRSKSAEVLIASNPYL